MKEYNGFSPKERNLSWDVQKKFRESGEMVWEGCKCDMCKQSNMNVMPHLENYFEVKEFKALCVECHMKLHGRFTSPTGWLVYLQELRNGYVPENYGHVMSYFRSKKSREFFRVSKDLPIFVKDNNANLKWFEKLSTEPIDIRSGLVGSGYSETHLKEQLHGLRMSKAPKRVQREFSEEILDV